MAGARLLIVDDEPQLVKLMSEFLRRIGYTVDCAYNGAEALEKLHSTQKYDVLIIDLTLPDMAGEDLMLQCVEIAPEAKVLVCSGYVWVPQKLAPELRKRVGFLLKPFLPKMLAKEIEKMTA